MIYISHVTDTDTLIWLCALGTEVLVVLLAQCSENSTVLFLGPVWIWKLTKSKLINLPRLVLISRRLTRISLCIVLDTDWLV